MKNKNLKRFLSLAMALCLSLAMMNVAFASNVADASGGSATSSVTLSSTEDGSLGGDPAATAMSVTVPTVERGLWLVVFWSMEMAGDRPVISSTSGFSIMPKNWRA